MPQPVQSPESRPVPRRVLALLALVALLWTGALAWHTRELFMDDGYIGLRHLENLLQGHGFGFNPGERVEGVTNLGWLLLLLPLSPLGLPLAAKLLGLVSLLAAVALTCTALLRLVRPGDRLLLALAPLPLLMLCHWDLTFYALAGMETGLLAALLGLMLYLTVRDNDRPWLQAVLGAAAFLVRPEALLVFPLWLLLRGRPTGRRPALALFLLLVGGATLARWLYFGDWVPNTFHAKPSSPLLVLDALLHSLAGTNTNLPFPFAGVWALLLLLLGVKRLVGRSRSAAAMAGSIVAVGWLFSAYALEDWSGTGRYFAPYVPVAFVLLWSGLLQGLELVLGQRRRGLRAGAGLVALLLLVTSCYTLLFRLSPVYLERYPGYVMGGRLLRKPCRWIRDHLPADAVIATRRIGAVGYLGKRRVFDYAFGLVHREVARLIAGANHRFHDPNHPLLQPLWQRRAPGYLLEDQNIVDQIARAAGGTPADFVIHGMHYRVKKRFPLGQQSAWLLCERFTP